MVEQGRKVISAGWASASNSASHQLLWEARAWQSPLLAAVWVQKQPPWCPLNSPAGLQVPVTCRGAFGVWEGELGSCCPCCVSGLWAMGGLAVGVENSSAKLSLVSSWCIRPGDVCMSFHDPSSVLVPLCHAEGMSVARRGEEHPWWLWCLWQDQRSVGHCRMLNSG